MTIDTKDVTTWVTKHLALCIPVACGVFAWYAACRWQAACDKNQIALMIFYFSVSAASGIVSLIMTIAHLNRLGFFNVD